jgi:hypothetical protein
MRSAGLLAALAGCGFHASAPPAQDQPADAGAADGPGAALDAGPTPDATAAVFCDKADGNLMVCYEFEDNVKDGSAHGFDASPSGVSYTDGKVGRAMKFAAGNSAHVAGSSVFNVSQLTLEAWVQPAQILAAAQVIVDVDMQYALVIDNNGTVTCDLRDNRTLTTTAKLVGGQWAHVACTWDGSRTRIYLDGTLSISNPGNGALPGGGHPMAIAANQPMGAELVGLIDQLRLMSVARSAAEICTDAGRTTCP